MPLPDYPAGSGGTVADRVASLPPKRPSSPGRRRHGALLAIACGLTVLLTACGTVAGGSSSAASDTSATTAGPGAQSGTTPSRIRSVCLDTTGSTPREFSEKVRALLVSELRSWVPAGEPDSSGSPATPGLDLRVRTVTAGAESGSDLSRHVVIDPVPELSPIPTDVGSDNYTAKLEQWNKDRDHVATKWTAAKMEADNAAQEIAQLPLGNPKASGIAACASTLALVTAAGPDRMFLIASDLEENAGSQLAGSFDQAPMTLLQPCPSGSLSRCRHLADTFSAQMRSLQAGPIDTVRSEQADQRIHSWLGAVDD